MIGQPPAFTNLKMVCPKLDPLQQTAFTQKEGSGDTCVECINKVMRKGLEK